MRKSCADWQAYDSSLSDGDYMIGTPAFEVYCHGMDTYESKEYLNLKEETNFGTFPPGGYSTGTLLTTKYAKIRINPFSLEIDEKDKTFATSTGKILQYNWPWTYNRTWESLSWGNTLSCGKKSYGMVDLTGTSFHISDFENKIIPTTYSRSPVFEEAGKRISFSAYGECGGIASSGLVLTHDSSINSM